MSRVQDPSVTPRGIVEDSLDRPLRFAPVAPAFAAVNAAADFRDRLVERRPVAELELFDGAGHAPVPLERAAAMPGAVAHPSLVTRVRKRDGDEARAQIVKA